MKDNMAALRFSQDTCLGTQSLGCKEAESLLDTSYMDILIEIAS